MKQPDEHVVVLCSSQHKKLWRCAGGELFAESDVEQRKSERRRKPVYVPWVFTKVLISLPKHEHLGASWVIKAPRKESLMHYENKTNNTLASFPSEGPQTNRTCIHPEGRDIETTQNGRFLFLLLESPAVNFGAHDLITSARQSGDTRLAHTLSGGINPFIPISARQWISISPPPKRLIMASKAGTQPRDVEAGAVKKQFVVACSQQCDISLHVVLCSVWTQWTCWKVEQKAAELDLAQRCS